ncbi:hypothetical protein, partial [uncultured Thiohalocapsa sp.]|uniref:hypothetical protein n=1 Tax=uncultured Thiohalocapsa sp. TaxID=768990 RepID=UPI0025EE0A77
ALPLLGLFDRPAAPALLDALRQAPPIPGLTEPLQGLDADTWTLTLANLADAGLIERRDPDGATAPDAGTEPDPGTDAIATGDPAATPVDAHPLIREHLGATLREQAPDAWREGHRRLYERLKTDTPHHPDGLSGLQPLYQAVAHGCQSGQWQDAFYQVYVDRILRGTGHDGSYSWKKLGAFGANLSALAHLFAEPWRRPVPALSAPAQAWLLNEAGFCLRALGRLAEALEPMRAGAEMAVEQQDWINAAINYNNLSELQLALGRIHAAVADARRAVDHADRSGDAFLRMARRTTLADALHQQGEAAAARAAFAEAEAMQAERQPEYPLLYSLRGFRYCDLLLAPAERAAWSGPGAEPRAGGGDGSSGDSGARERDGAGDGAQGEHGAGPVAVCAEVSRRAGQTLEWAEQNQAPLLDFGLDHLTLARCALYADRLQGRPPGPEARYRAERALDRLRAAGREDYIPHGLLTRARIRHALGDPAGADADLCEAERIAERGAMALHRADCALTRARLFQDPAALALARRLIEQHGYRRRLPELEDAEAAARRWPERKPATTASEAATNTTGTTGATGSHAPAWEHGQTLQRPGARHNAPLERRPDTPTLERGSEERVERAAPEPEPTPTAPEPTPMPITELPDHRLGLLPIAGCDAPDRALDLVLVHGLGGDAFTTWMSDPEQPETFWPNWLAADRPRLGIWTLGYAADASGWRAESMPLADRGTQVLDQLASDGLGERPLVFVTHSLGGIVAKQVLRHAGSYGVPRWRHIAEQTRGIAFIATPHSGANLASFAQFASAVFRTNEQVKELAAHDPRLRELHSWFRAFYTEQDLICRTWCERREVRPNIPLLGIKLTKGLLVVDATSTEPGLSGEVAVPLDEDHISICKPASRDAQLYKSLLRWVDECVAAGASRDVDSMPSTGVSDSKQRGSQESEDSTMSAEAVDEPDHSAAPHGLAIARWREKLALLLEQEALAADPAQRFQLKQQIGECRTKLRELGDGQ